MRAVYSTLKDEKETVQDLRTWPWKPAHLRGWFLPSSCRLFLCWCGRSFRGFWVLSLPEDRLWHGPWTASEGTTF